MQWAPRASYLLLVIGPATLTATALRSLGWSRAGAPVTALVAFAAAFASMVVPLLVLARLRAPHAHDDANGALAVLGLYALGLGALAHLTGTPLVLVALDVAVGAALVCAAMHLHRVRARWLSRVVTGQEPGWLVRPRGPSDRALLPLAGGAQRCNAVLERVDDSLGPRLHRHAPVALVHVR
jgi:hypothetical protein